MTEDQLGAFHGAHGPVQTKGFGWQENISTTFVVA